MTDQQKTMAAVDGTDALAFVIIRPAKNVDGVSIEAAAVGLDKPTTAHILRHVAKEFDAESKAPAPRTQRSYWQDIADALNAAEQAGMSVGIDLDGTLTDRNTWSVVWLKTEQRWTVAGWDEDIEQAAEAPAETVVYRASHDSIVMGLYTTAAAARAHCEAEERRTWSKSVALAFDWIEDEEDGVAELAVTADQSDEGVTGYVVTALTVASEYDEEADA